MKSIGLKGIVRGRRTITTNPDAARPCFDDKVNRAFKAERPNQLRGEPLFNIRSDASSGLVRVAALAAVKQAHDGGHC